MTSGGIGGIAEWLVGGARSAVAPQDVLSELCDRLVALGIPLWRAAVFVRTLHPNVTGRRFLWRAESGVAVGELAYERLITSEFTESPVSAVYASGGPLRRRIANAEEAADFEVLRGLHAEGATDYLASPLPFTDGSIHVATWTTRRSVGFSDADIAALEAVAAPLARVAEIRALRRTAGTLLDTYVGTHAGHGQDPSRRCRDDPCRHLAIGHARLHRVCRPVAAGRADRAPQPLFRLPGAGDPRARGRGAEIHG